MKHAAARQLLHGLMALDILPHRVDVDPIPVVCPPLPEAFRLARIAVVTDTHFPDAMIGADDLVRTVRLQKPDAVFLLGDLTNSYADFDEENLRRLATGLAAVAPCFAIPGNHEFRWGREPRYGAILRECGVTYLCDGFADWTKDGQTVRLFGMGRRRPRPFREEDRPVLALAHKPNYFSYYQSARWPLVFCGHAHGGQIRVGQKAAYAPGQGVLPSYTDGVYREDGTTMVVSRGLGNSSVPFRFGNQAHLPLILLVPKEE